MGLLRENQHVRYVFRFTVTLENVGREFRRIWITIDLVYRRLDHRRLHDRS